ncbi:SurA N-terminal domain-containing protein [Thermosulfurimonas sp. F29]|uniref:SurA N-terminal domain-containing protein n=1 Tax=Thermosulfurimonas sp. F29 TaxID=2867247 RepID=UPI001C82BF4E|nr:SurA N-terminal domain-containing protein [Thermosulfurimonas sp. F29]MBX6422697.1 SurA N-terminal domain-containing protein [Thermosulfurimonas sp. F29]
MGWRRVFVLILLFVFPVAGVTKGKILDRIAAVVNDEVITLSEVDEAALPLYRKYLRGVTDPLEEEKLVHRIRREVLNQLIEEKLIEQEVKKYKITVSDEEVEAFLKEVVSRVGGEEAFRRFLAEQGLTPEEYRQRIRDQLRKIKLIRGSVQARIVITDEDIERYYREHYLSAKNRVYHLAAIVTTEESRIRKAWKALQKGADFAEVARRYSEIPGSGSDLGRFKLEELAPEARKALAGAKAGQVLPPLKASGRWYIFKVLSVESPATRPLAEVREEIRQKLYQKALDEYFQKWLKELKERAFIKVFI